MTSSYSPDRLGAEGRLGDAVSRASPHEKSNSRARDLVVEGSSTRSSSASTFTRSSVSSSSAPWRSVVPQQHSPPISVPSAAALPPGSNSAPTTVLLSQTPSAILAGSCPPLPSEFVSWYEQWCRASSFSPPPPTGDSQAAAAAWASGGPPPLVQQQLQLPAYTPFPPGATAGTPSEASGNGSHPSPTAYSLPFTQLLSTSEVPFAPFHLARFRAGSPQEQKVSSRRSVGTQSSWCSSALEEDKNRRGFKGSLDTTSSTPRQSRSRSSTTNHNRRGPAATARSSSQLLPQRQVPAATDIKGLRAVLQEARSLYQRLSDDYEMFKQNPDEFHRQRHGGVAPSITPASVPRPSSLVHDGSQAGSEKSRLAGSGSGAGQGEDLPLNHSVPHGLVPSFFSPSPTTTSIAAAAVETPSSLAPFTLETYRLLEQLEDRWSSIRQRDAKQPGSGPQPLDRSSLLEVIQHRHASRAAPRTV